MYKILVIGSSGMVGHMITNFMQKAGHDVFEVSRKKIPTNKIFAYDLIEYKKIFSLIDKEDFDFCINCAAVLVRESEQNRYNAVFCNAYFPQLLAEHCLNKKVKIVQLSSGGVFSGRDSIEVGEDVYWEKSLLSPPTFYGATKAAGEILNDKDITIRTDFWGVDSNSEGSGIFNWIMQQSDKVTGYDDIHFNGISNLEFCHFLSFLFEQKKLAGVIHVGAKQHISKGNLLRLISKQFNLNLDVAGSKKMSLSVVLKNTFEIGYQEKSYEQMCMDIKSYLFENKDKYPHYRI